MHRRHVLAGLAAGIPLFAGCSALTGGGGNGGNESNGTSGTSGTGGTTKGGNEATAAATTAAKTTTQVATATPAATATSTPTTTTAPTSVAPTATPPVQTTTGPQATEQATASGTTAGGAAGGAVVIDPSQLKTYSSESYPYRIDYPAGWTVDASNPTSVMIQPGTGFALEQIIASEGMGGVTVDTYVSRFTGILKQQFDTYRVTNRQDVTLPNGNPGIVLDTTIADSAFQGNTIHGKYLFAVADGTAYVVQLLVSKDAYTPTVRQGMTAIINSFTVQST